MLGERIKLFLWRDFFINLRLTAGISITRLTGGLFLPPPPENSGTAGPIDKIQTAFDRSGNFSGKPNVVDLGVTDNVTGQIKVKIVDDLAYLV